MISNKKKVHIKVKWRENKITKTTQILRITTYIYINNEKKLKEFKIKIDICL